MKNITRLWTQLTDSLAEVTNNQSFMAELYSKFGEIFDLKDANEYKIAGSISDVMTPKQFSHTSAAMQRAFVEGYLLAQMEQKHNDIKFLYQCHRKELSNENSNFNLNDYPNIPRPDNPGISNRKANMDNDILPGRN